MHVRVRVFGKPDTIIVVESRLTKIEQFRWIVKEKLHVAENLQCLFYGGKLLEDGYTFHDYNIKLNDVIQLLVRGLPDYEIGDESKKCYLKSQCDTPKEQKKIEYVDANSLLYTVGDLVDIKDTEQGAWFEGKVVRIIYNPAMPIVIKEAASNSITNAVNFIDTTNNHSKESNIENTPPAQSDQQNLNCEKKSITKYFSKSSNLKKSPIEESSLADDSVSKNTEDNLLFYVQYDGETEDSNIYSKLKDIRPRARRYLDVNDLEIGQKVMINHNTEHPTEKGYWYDFMIDAIKKNTTNFELIGTLYLGPESVPQNNTIVKIHDKIFAIEEPVPKGERTKEYSEFLLTPTEKRSRPLICVTCRDNEDAPCKDCGCHHCLGKENPEKIVLCDECNNGYHMQCLSPPLMKLPKEDWYCPTCKRDLNEVIAPGAAKQTRKINASKSNRDWGRGMACVGKTKTSVMPPNHFGPIPGIEVGMCWRFRIQLSESGVHRPPVSGIHGRDTEGAYSIVLSGGYEDDVDYGNEFTYTGSGGRDLSGNKRTAEQSCDQTLNRENKALARNCAVKEISEKGGDAGENWRNGKPVRVVRSYKMLKHFPKYAPREGIRYDGIYKVVKYYPEKGLSGFRVWKYLLRRDDPSPAPWEPGSKQYTVTYPDGYLEAEAQKKALKMKNGMNPKRGKKRTLKESNYFNDTESEEKPPGKKRKIKDSVDMGNKKKLPRNKKSTEVFTSVSMNIPCMQTAEIEKTKTIIESAISDKEKKVIKADTLNSKLWDECLGVYETKGKKEFVDQVTQAFLCIICQDVTVSPVTSPCLHNFCMGCLKLAFKSTGAQTCPACRQNLSKYEPQQNEHLRTALRVVLPGYDVGKK